MKKKDKELLMYAGGGILLLLILLSIGGLRLFALTPLTCSVQKSCSQDVTVSGLPAPDNDATDGKLAYIYCASFIMDSNGAYKVQSTPTQMTGTTYTGTISFTPDTAGNYVYGAVCLGTNNTYDFTARNAGTCIDPPTSLPSCWKGWTTPVVVGGDNASITVTGPTPPPAPTFDFWGIINGIVCWFKQLFGQTC